LESLRIWRNISNSSTRSNMKNDVPLVFDIVRGSLVDGPGIRTVVFLKGCPLRCRWCHNPEGLKPEQEIVFIRDACIACGECMEACEINAIDLFSADRIVRDLCNRCAVCAESCDSLALRFVGKEFSIQDLLDLILKDKIYFETSGGGVTFSGGEPLMHMEFLNPLLRKLKTEGIHVVIETSGCFDLSVFKEKIMPYADLLLYDLKLLDAKEHMRYTGSGNKGILHNFQELIRDGEIEITPRIPLVPKITATNKNLTEIARFIGELGVQTFNLLSYNPSGLDKWTELGYGKPIDVVEAAFTLADEQIKKRMFEEEVMRQDIL